MRSIKLFSVTFCLVVSFAGCKASDSTSSPEESDSALERYIDEPRERARDVKSEVERKQEEDKEKLDEVLE